MSLARLVIALICLGIAVWGVKQFTPEPISERFSALLTKVLYVVAVICVVLWAVPLLMQLIAKLGV